MTGKYPAECSWQEDARQNGGTFHFRRLAEGRMLLVFHDQHRGAWYWQVTAGLLPRGATYVSGPDYADADAAKGAADHWASAA